MGTIRQSAKFDNDDRKRLDELAQYFGVKNSDICGAALSMLYENSDLFNHKTQDKALYINELEKVCGSSTFDVLKEILANKKAKNKIIIIKNDNEIIIPANTSVKFMPPHVICFEVSAAIEVSMDICPSLKAEIYDEVSDRVLPASPESLAKKGLIIRFVLK